MVSLYQGYLAISEEFVIKNLIFYNNRKQPMDGVKEKGDIEVLFRCFFPIPTPSKAAVEKYLLDTFKGLEVASIKTYALKNSFKATVTSNAADLILKGCEAAAKTTDGEGCKMCAVLQPQIMGLTAQLSELDSARYQLEEENKELQSRVAELSQRVTIREEANSVLKRSSTRRVSSSAAIDMEVIEGMLTHKQEQIEECRREMEAEVTRLNEEKQELQDKMDMLSLKVLEAHDMANEYIEKANKADSLQVLVEGLSKEKEEVIDDLKKMERDYNEKEEERKKVTDRLIEFKEKHKAEIAEAEAKYKEKSDELASLEVKNAEANEKILSLESASAKLSEELQTLKRNTELLEAAKATLEKDNERLKKEGSKSNAANNAKLQKQLKEKDEELRKFKENAKSEKELLMKIESLKTDNARLEMILKLTEEGKVRKEQELTQIKGKMHTEKSEVEMKEREEKEKSMADVRTRELDRLSEDLDAKTRQIEVQKEYIKEAQSRMEALQAKNKALQLDAEEKKAAMQHMQALKARQELLISENASLKAALLEQSGSATPSPGEEVKGSSSKKAQILEETKEMLANVIYAYKTLCSTAKKLMLQYDEKKLKLDAVLTMIGKANTAKKKEEFMEIMKGLETSIVFLKGIPDKVKSMKMIVGCLNEVGSRKKDKLKMYEEEIVSLKEAFEVASAKVDEYEERLVLFC